MRWKLQGYVKKAQEPRRRAVPGAGLGAEIVAVSVDFWRRLMQAGWDDGVSGVEWL